MFCAECGTQLPENAEFCLDCGNRREVVGATPTSPAAGVSLATVTGDGWAVDPTRNVWLQPIEVSEEPISEKSRATAAARGSTTRSEIDRHTHSEAATHRAAAVRLRNSGSSGALSQPLSSNSIWSAPRTISLTPGYLGIAAAVLVIVGSLGPWVTATLPFVGAFTVSGTDGDGKATLCCGILAGALIAFLVTSNQSGVWLGIIAGIGLGIAAVVGIVDWGNISDEISSSDQDLEGLVRVGWGLQVMTISAIVGAVLSIVQAVKATELT